VPIRHVLLVSVVAILFPLITGRLPAQDTSHARGAGLWVDVGAALGRAAVEDGTSGTGPAFEIGAGGTLPSGFRIGLQFVRQRELQDGDLYWNARTVTGVVLHDIATSPVSLIGGVGVTHAWHHGYTSSASASAAEAETGVEWDAPRDSRLAFRVFILKLWKLGPLRTSEPTCAPGSSSSCIHWDTLNQWYFGIGLLVR